MKKLITIDLDGTMLSDDGTISAENIKAVHEAQNAGHIVAISSGRSKQDTAHIAAQAGIHCPMTTGNGSKSSYNGKEVQALTLTGDIVKELIPILDGENAYYEIYTSEGILYNTKQKQILFDEIAHLKQETDDSYEWTESIITIQMNQHGLIPVTDYHTIDFNEAGVYKIFVLSFDETKLKALRLALVDKKVALTSSGHQKLEISHELASKGNALAFMADYFKIPMANTIAIGDNLNDLSMIQVAGTGIAMGNAEAAVKEQSTYVTLPYNENGVAYALRNYCK